MNHQLSDRIVLFRLLDDSRSCWMRRFDRNTIMVAYTVFRNGTS